MACVLCIKRLVKIQFAMLCIIYILSGCRANVSSLNEEVTTTGNYVENQYSYTHTEAFIENEESKYLQIDLADYFQGINGSIVIFNDSANEYGIYNTELSEERSSPCSTFKIVSALVGLNERVIESGDTVINWNGVKYPIDEWNKDLTMRQAFQSSCIWYFRTVIDRVGQEPVNKILNELSYGNCDTSQWKGSNTNKDFDELNGFWLESSLLISPREQVDVLINIFSEKSNADKQIVSIIKDIMEIDNADNSFSVYGKTGTGVKDGMSVNAWFIGIAENQVDTYYFALRLSDTVNGAATGKNAKEIGLNIINSYL